MNTISRKICYGKKVSNKNNFKKKRLRNVSTNLIIFTSSK